MVEKNAVKMNGYLGVLAGLVITGISAYMLINGSTVLPIVLLIAVAVLLSGITIVQPNEAKVLTFFGTYVGVIREQGLWLAIPFTIKSSVSLRVINFNSDTLK